jgi:hypothetical protein
MSTDKLLDEKVTGSTPKRQQAQAKGLLELHLKVTSSDSEQSDFLTLKGGASNSFDPCCSNSRGIRSIAHPEICLDSPADHSWKTTESEMTAAEGHWSEQGSKTDPRTHGSEVVLRRAQTCGAAHEFKSLQPLPQSVRTTDTQPGTCSHTSPRSSDTVVDVLPVDVLR